jgi:hypothetical protein
MNIDNETFEEIQWGDHEDFEAVTDTIIEDQSRWSVYKSCVYRQKSTGKLFNAYWGEGATESQEGQDEYWSFTEVEPYEVTVIKYREIKDGQQFEGSI